MENLEYKRQLLLHDFEQFESEFLQPQDPQPISNHLKMENMSWIEELERDFVDNQLCIKNFELNDTTFKPSDINLPITENLNIFGNSPTSVHDISYPLALPPLEDLGDDELPNQTNDTNDHKLLQHDENIDPANVDDHSPSSLSGLVSPDFNISANTHLEINKTAQADEANRKYGEEFAKKVENNVRVFQEAMQRIQKGSNEGERAVEVEGVCCNGKCWRYMQTLLSTVPKIPKGRKRKGFKLSPQEIAIAKERQKIKNRISAAAAYKREKEYLQNLEVQVEELRAENKTRRNFVKFQESASQIQHENTSLSRTISGPL